VDEYIEFASKASFDGERARAAIAAGLREVARLQEAAHKIERLEAALSWVREVRPWRNAESGGAVVHMTWDQWNELRRALGLREQ